MGKLSRTKGAKFEREIAAYFNDHLEDILEEKVKRNLDQYQAKGLHDLTLPGVMIECKRQKSVRDGDVKKWWTETLDQVEGQEAMPVLIYRADAQTAKAVVPGAVIMSLALANSYQVEQTEGFEVYRLSPAVMDMHLTMELGTFVAWYRAQFTVIGEPDDRPLLN